MAAPPDRQLYPLKVDVRTNEVYLQLPAPHDNIIITPPRLSDAEAIVSILNDPRVHKALIGPPFPYLLAHAESWLATVRQGSDTILGKLKEAGVGCERENAPLANADGCPVRTLREIKEDGSEVFLGDIDITRCGRFDYLRDKEEEDAKVSRNAQLPAGSPEIVWDIGDYLAPSHHGKGIMSAALRTIICDWAVPRMNAHTVHGMAFSGNIGSVKVFLKNDFEGFDHVDGCVTIPDSKGGGTTGLHFLAWRHPS